MTLPHGHYVHAQTPLVILAREDRIAIEYDRVLVVQHLSGAPRPLAGASTPGAHNRALAAVLPEAVYTAGIQDDEHIPVGVDQ